MLPWWLSGKEPTCQCRRHDLIPGREDTLEKETATHSSILAWEIPWTDEPGRATVHGVTKKIRYNLVTKQYQCQNYHKWLEERVSFFKKKSTVSRYIVVVQLLSHVWLFVTYELQHARLPCPSISRSLLKLMSIKLLQRILKHKFREFSIFHHQGRSDSSECPGKHFYNFFETMTQSKKLILYIDPNTHHTHIIATTKVLWKL